MADDEIARLTMPVSTRDHAQGSADAPVTLVEYGDYECPHCGRAYPVVKEVQRRLGSRLRFVFRNFPLSESHPHALVDRDQRVFGNTRALAFEQHGVDRREPAEIAQHVVNSSRIRLGVSQLLIARGSLISPPESGSGGFPAHAV